MAALDLMTHEVEGEEFYLLDEEGFFVLDDENAESCCCSPLTGCCPNTLVLPTIANDPLATNLQLEVIAIQSDNAECCYDESIVGVIVNFVPSAPLFWLTCDLLPVCLRGILLTCANNQLILQWALDGCPGNAALPLSPEEWEIISVQCDPIEFIYKYTFTQAFPEKCQFWTITVKVTKQP